MAVHVNQSDSYSFLFSYSSDIFNMSFFFWRGGFLLEILEMKKKTQNGSFSKQQAKRKNEIYKRQDTYTIHHF